MARHNRPILPTAMRVIPEAEQGAELPRPPVRAIAIKGQQLRAAMRGGAALDWADIHERFVDLWQETRLCIWRAKHRQVGVKMWDPVAKREVTTFMPDDRTVLLAVDTCRGVLEGLMKVRDKMGGERAGIPRYAVDAIEEALRDYPEAQQSLLKRLTEHKD